MKKILLVMAMIMAFAPICLSATETYNQIEDGTFTIGTDCAYAPYAFTTTEENASSTAVQITDSKAYCDGYDVMIAKTIADKLGVDLEVKVISFDGLIPALNSGQIDAIVAGMSATDERKEEIDFSNNYYDDNLVMSIVTSTDSDYANASALNDFKDANISSQLGTFHGELLKYVPGVNEVAPMESVDSLMQATKAGTIDGYITEEEAAIAQADSNPDLTYINLNGMEIPPEFTGVALGIKKGSDEFVAEINAILNDINNEQKAAMMKEAADKSNGEYVEPKGFLASSYSLFTSNKELYISGIEITLILALLGTLFGTLIGFLIVGLRIQKVHYKDKRYIKILKKWQISSP